MMQPAHRVRPFAVAGLLFAGCTGLLLLMTFAKPPEPEEAPGTVEQLDAPRVIATVPCAGFVRRDAQGRLTSCILSEDHAFETLVLPSNSRVQFRPDGTPSKANLGRAMRFDGHLCRGDGPGGWMADFYPDGRLAAGFLVERETIDGVPCERGSFWGEVTGGVGVRFHPDGRLESCRLAADAVVAGQRFEAGQRIRLDPQGRPAPADPSGTRLR